MGGRAREYEELLVLCTAMGEVMGVGE